MSRARRPASADPASKLLAALHEFRAAIRARKMRVVELFRQLRAEHEADRVKLEDAEARFIKAIDPDEYLLLSGLRGLRKLVVQCGLDLHTVRDFLDEVFPSDDVSDAEGDIRTAMDEMPNEDE